ncbi:hypothetical protein EHS25_003864 [Saitozyma podzolica]|uniref:Uncharacterized protein n=1 Tax=Saitozyma podzolica TaxID=1890683 RepID=A0A427Y3R6_9TREE|nr:hypothetical protein EHS25_003864 [Saitozyma podzolica]
MEGKYLGTDASASLAEGKVTAMQHRVRPRLTGNLVAHNRHLILGLGHQTSPQARRWVAVERITVSPHSPAWQIKAEGFAGAEMGLEKGT